jgi:hypothetical protein
MPLKWVHRLVSGLGADKETLGGRLGAASGRLSRGQRHLHHRDVEQAHDRVATETAISVDHLRSIEA